MVGISFISQASGENKTDTQESQRKQKLWPNRNLSKFIFVRILILQRASVLSTWFKPCLNRIRTKWLFTALLIEEQKILCCFTTPTNFILMQNLTACHLMNEVISKWPALPFLCMSSVILSSSPYMLRSWLLAYMETVSCYPGQPVSESSLQCASRFSATRLMNWTWLA